MAPFTTSRKVVGLPDGSRTPSDFRMVVWSAFHCGSSGSGSRTPRNPQPVMTPWSPFCMWQVWQVGAAAVAGSAPSFTSSWRTPCLEASYISHWAWSKPMWQVLHACGSRASFTEKVWRVWQESQLPAP